MLLSDLVDYLLLFVERQIFFVEVFDEICMLFYFRFCIVQIYVCRFEASTNAVKEVQDQELLDFTARKLVEMAADIIMCHLLIQDASKSSELFSKSAHVYLNYAEAVKSSNY